MIRFSLCRFLCSGRLQCARVARVRVTSGRRPHAEIAGKDREGTAKALRRTTAVGRTRAFLLPSRPFPFLSLFVALSPCAPRQACYTLTAQKKSHSRLRAASAAERTREDKRAEEQRRSYCKLFPHPRFLAAAAGAGDVHRRVLLPDCLQAVDGLALVRGQGEDGGGRTAEGRGREKEKEEVQRRRSCVSSFSPDSAVGTISRRASRFPMLPRAPPLAHPGSLSPAVAAPRQQPKQEATKPYNPLIFLLPALCDCTVRRLRGGPACGPAGG